MTGTINQIQIDRATLGSALNQKRLRVDINQREYSWEEEHVRDLYQDFSDTITTGEPGSEHFLGSIVVTRETGGFSKVVDGQQRLATTMILLAAIRDYVYENDVKDRATALENHFLITVDPDTLEPVPHLKLSGHDNDYFKKRILALPGSSERDGVKIDRPSHDLINQAAIIAKEWVEREAASARQGHAYSRLKIWKDFVEQRARVIWLEVPDDITAFRIFETMNDRGLGLSQADLLKNFLLYTIADEDQAEAYGQWQKMQGAIESVSDDKKALVTYIRHYWLSARSHTTADELYSHINKKIRTKAEAVSLIGSLNSSAPLYAALLNPDHNFWNQFPESLRYQVSTLHGLRIAQVRPLLLAGIQKFKENHAELERFFNSLVNWSVRFLISGGLGGGVLETRYGQAARQVTEGEVESVSELTESLISIIPPDIKFQEDFANAQVRKVYLAKYYLSALEHELRGEREPQFDVSKRGGINLEHILPESAKGYDPEIARTYRTRLGNIVLLQQSRNSQLGDADYVSVKSPVLQESQFELTKEASGKAAWGPLEIMQRQQRLAKLAVETWPVRV